MEVGGKRYACEMVYKIWIKKICCFILSASFCQLHWRWFLGLLYGKLTVWNERKNRSMNWLCTMFFLAAGLMCIFFVLNSTAYNVRKEQRFSLLLISWEHSRNLYSNFFCGFYYLCFSVCFWVSWRRAVFRPCFCLFLAYSYLIAVSWLMLFRLQIGYEKVNLSFSC